LDNLPDPDVLAKEILDNLAAAQESFAALVDGLGV
jgi:hypothetical protein